MLQLQTHIHLRMIRPSSDNNKGDKTTNNTADKTPRSPGTGDYTNIGLYVGFLFISLAVILGLLFYRRRYTR